MMNNKKLLLLSLAVVWFSSLAFTPTPPPKPALQQPTLQSPLSYANLTKKYQDSRVKIEPSFLFLQEGESGTLNDNKDGTYSLVMKNVLPHTVYFSERPVTIAGKLPMSFFIEKFPWGGNGVPLANAAISLRDGKEQQDTIIVQIQKPPLYDSQKNTLAYIVKIIKNIDNKKFDHFVKKADSSLPQNFKAVDLYIDSDRLGQGFCGEGPVNCYGELDPLSLCHQRCGQTDVIPKCFWWTALSCGPCDADEAGRQCMALPICNDPTHLLNLCGRGCALFFRSCEHEPHP